jgi:hypothetical protein
MNVDYPMLFEVTNNTIGKKTNCGVLEFSAEEGWCYMPFGMMQNLMVSFRRFGFTFLPYQNLTCALLAVGG